MSGKLDELDWVQIIVNYGELSDSIKALTERVDELEDAKDTITIPKYVRYEEHTRHQGKSWFYEMWKEWHKKDHAHKLPPSGPVKLGPVLNDGKAKPSKDIIILDHPMDHMVSDEELDNIYVSPAVNSWPKPMWEVARGNTMRGILYSLEDAKMFAEAIKY
jgi:hypothetical protein